VGYRENILIYKEKVQRRP